MNKEEWAQQQSKKSLKEDTFLLSELIKINGCCTWCMIKKCKNLEEHGADFPMKMSDFVLKPNYIKEILEIIKNNDLGFKDITLYYTTCIHGINNGRCKNCIEGRFKYVDFKGIPIRFCFPPFENKTKMTIGIHDFDIKLILRGKQYEVSAFPIKYEEEEVYHSIENEETSFSVKEEKIDTYEDLFPQIEGSPTSKVQNNDEVKKFDYSSIIQKNHDEKDKTDDTDIIGETSKIKLQEKEQEQEEVQEKVDNSKYMTLFDENKENLLIIDKLNAKIYAFERKIKELESKNTELKNKNVKEMEIIKNKHKYDEILHNLQNLNAISKQFFNEENYSEYLVIDY